MSTKGKGTIISTMRFHDAPRAIEWLCDAFGFEKHLVVRGEDEGTIAHAQLTLGDAMIMLSSHRDDEFGKLQVAMPSRSAVTTQSAYVIVDDCDQHHARAVAAGAEVVMPPEDQDYGGRLYTCRDLEGHVWSFGTYDPWREG
jgi:uncharacterized glyoxalase superfamily protein PhnB